MRGGVAGKPRRDRALWVLGGLAAILVALGIIAFFSLRTDRIPTRGPSMRPTLAASEPVTVDAGAYDDRAPEIGEIVVLQGPSSIRSELCGAPHPEGSPCPVAVDDYGGTRLLKRVVGAPGDTIAFARDGSLIRNGRRVREPYIVRCPGTCALPRPITVPADHLFVAGDNRPRSTDSRYWGAVPTEAIDAKVILDD